MTSHDQAAAFAHRDRPRQALLLNDRGKKLNLMRAVPVRIGRVRLEHRRIDEGVVRAMDLHARREFVKARRLAARLLAKSLVREHQRRVGAAGQRPNGSRPPGV